ncbi:hypothetical protein LTR50_004922 [Elasticomyces elasticus]|nr:hypothetical protein LTR50_004922 [Elasticomyces elasticus]
MEMNQPPLLRDTSFHPRVLDKCQDIPDHGVNHILVCGHLVKTLDDYNEKCGVNCRGTPFPPNPPIYCEVCIKQDFLMAQAMGIVNGFVIPSEPASMFPKLQIAEMKRLGKSWGHIPALPNDVQAVLDFDPRLGPPTTRASQRGRSRSPQRLDLRKNIDGNQKYREYREREPLERMSPQPFVARGHKTKHGGCERTVAPDLKSFTTAELAIRSSVGVSRTYGSAATTVTFEPAPAAQDSACPPTTVNPELAEYLATLLDKLKFITEDDVAKFRRMQELAKNQSVDYYHVDQASVCDGKSAYTENGDQVSSVEREHSMRRLARPDHDANDDETMVDPKATTDFSWADMCVGELDDEIL